MTYILSVFHLFANISMMMIKTAILLLLQRKAFVRLARVFPLAEFLGIPLDPHMYRAFVGMTEVTGGIMLGMFQGIPILVFIFLL
jgi:hypothetical protein